jgi:hypothetical protein
MGSAVCTLFEGDYHYGVAALINSLYDKGFRGTMYVGYRGELPGWASLGEKRANVYWAEYTTLELDKNFSIHFFPVYDECHFTNYKPTFMLELIEGPASNAENIFYFDPDIVNKCSWSFYERWVGFGVALVHETVWNDMPANHPKRMQWKQIAKDAGFEIKNNLNSYINAGFIGVNDKQIGFLRLWSNLIEFSALHYNLDKTKFNQSEHDADMFKVADQDLLNLAAMCTNESLSEMGPEGMDFIGGGWLMSHATGTPKPWKWNPLIQILYGRPPRQVDREFWNSANGMISSYPKSLIYRRLFEIKVAAFIGRFYRRAGI